MTFNTFLSSQWALVRRLGFILILFTASRLLFFLFNLSFFYPLDLVQLAKSFFFGIRFDFIAIFYLNIFFILLHLFCFDFIERPVFQNVLKGLFIFVNTTLLLFNLIDVSYFQYTRRRSGWELIDMLITSSDTRELIPVYIVHYWYLVLILFAFIYALFRLYPKNRPVNISVPFAIGIQRIFAYLLAIIILLLGFAFARGLETKPIRMISTNKYVAPNYSPLLLNTPFTLINTINQHPEKINHYFPLDEVPLYYSSLHRPQSKGEFKRMNVVIIILESFGKEYVEAKTEDGKKIVPFLDSIKRVGLNCTNAYANAKRSIDAMPPILGGFPSLLHISFIGSAYSINALRGLPSILKEQGYTTSFYHGGANGTMGFDLFCKSIGFDSYYGRKEYNNEKDFDGAWGIWDEEFLQYMARNLNQTKEPFLSVVFTLSSHEPYSIPKKYEKRFFPDQPRVLQAIAYTDYALRQFFAAASSMKWFKNTLFVFCPDHTSSLINKQFNNNLAAVSIPIIYFCPSDSTLRGDMSKITQQIDVIPSILDYLNYNQPYISYGKSLFEEGYRFSVSYSDPNYQIVDSALCLLFDGEKTIRADKYNKDDLTFSEDFSDQITTQQKELEIYLKAYIEDYYFRLNNNLLADTIEIGNYKQ